MAPHKTFGIPAHDEDEWIAEPPEITLEDLDTLLAQEDDDPMDEYRDIY